VIKSGMESMEPARRDKSISLF